MGQVTLGLSYNQANTALVLRVASACTRMHDESTCSPHMQDPDAGLGSQAVLQYLHQRRKVYNSCTLPSAIAAHAQLAHGMREQGPVRQ